MKDKKKLDTYPETDICPLCGSDQVEYSDGTVDHAGYSYTCECHDCKARWNECYDMVFAGCWNIVDKDGQEYEDLPT